MEKKEREENEEAIERTTGDGFLAKGKPEDLEDGFKSSPRAVERSDEAAMKKHTPRLARRPWLDGLRGFAALLVLFYHAKTPLFAHGFIGVDVFFALFGFLLCSILILELKESSGIVLGNYYYRRAKRLLPLSLLVLILAAVAEKLFMNPMDSMQHRSLYFSAALYHANWRLLFDAADYFTPSDAVAPVQHYWSLSVEEQMAFVFPLVLWALFAWRGYNPRSRLLLFAFSSFFLFAITYTLSLSSFNTGSDNSESDLNRAYMGTAGRVYQLVGGALIALITGSYQLPNKIISSGKTVIIVGTLILVWVSFISTAINSVMGYFEWNNTTSTPGFSYKVISLLGMTEFNVIEMSVIGFIGAVTIIFGFESFSMNKDLTKEKEGEGQGKGVGNFVIALFSNAVLRHFGDLSYGIYLWHFPIIIIGNVVYLPESQPLRTILVFALSYGLSYVSHRFVESPIRNLSTPRPALVALFGVLCSVIVAFLCFHILTGDEAVVALYDGFKAGGASLFMFGNAKNASEVEEAGSPSTGDPGIENEKGGGGDGLTEEERQKDISSLPAPNILGEEHKGAIFKGGKRRIAVIGDSIAAMWIKFLTHMKHSFPDLRIDYVFGSTCPWHYQTDNPKTFCVNKLLPSFDKLLLEEKLDFVFVASYGSFTLGKATEGSSAWERKVAEGVRTQLLKWTNRTNVVIFMPTNIPTKNIPRCLIAHPTRGTPAKVGTRCDAPAGEPAHFASYRRGIMSGVELFNADKTSKSSHSATAGASPAPINSKVKMINSPNFFCPEGTCKALARNGKPTWFDANHMTDHEIFDPKFIPLMESLLANSCVSLQKGKITC